MSTVCQGIAEEYSRQFGLPAPTVITNAPPYEDLQPSPLVGGKIRLVHHGIANPSRKLELMIDAMKLLDDKFTLDLMLMRQDTPYYRHLQALAASDPRIRFRDPVPMPEIAKFINQFDVGVYVLPPGNFNQEMALPNKFFEFVQARLALVVGPSPEMAQVVQQHGLGVVTETFTAEALAKALIELSIEAIGNFKVASGKAASVLSLDGNTEHLRNLVLGAVPRREQNDYPN